MNLLAKVKAGFTEVFSHSPAFIIKAPGRVNLIGEHTDYNDGFVLPCAIEYATLVAVSPRNDNIVSVCALDYQNERDEFSLDTNIEFVQAKMWSNYIRGVIAELQQRGFALSGCNVAITGNVPQGAGLSSSASLEVGIAYAFNHLNSLDIAKQEIALISQAAENNFVGCACGIMDQLISACGKDSMAIGIDCRSLELTDVSIPQGMTIMMVNSNVKRGLVDSEYNVRRQQCEQAAAFFGVSHLRDVSIAEFEERQTDLESIVAKRAEHLVDLIASVIGDKGGVRMTGGGFGGCVVALVPDDLVAAVTAEVEKNYEPKTGIKETIYTSQPEIGVHVIEGI